MDYKVKYKKEKKCLWRPLRVEKGLCLNLVEKQYGKAIKVEEVTKVVDLALERFFNQKD
jgi:trigger factor